MNKSALREAILHQLRIELDRQVGAAHLARDEAINEESQPENKWDTHSQEAAYLAEGQAKLALEIQGNLTHYATMPLPAFDAGAPIALGALVELRGAAGDTWYFVGPRAGGMELKLDGRDVLVVTPQSPLGRQLCGKRVGDTVAGLGRSGEQTIVALL